MKNLIKISIFLIFISCQESPTEISRSKTKGKEVQDKKNDKSKDGLWTDYHANRAIKEKGLL